MSQLSTLLHRGRIRQTVFGLSRSHVNSTKIFSIDKSFSIGSNNMPMVYEASISYYNGGFAKETGEVLQPKSLIKDYLTLIRLMYSEEFSHEKTVVSVKDINPEDAMLDYSLFILYVLLINYKNIRVAVWENFHDNGLSQLLLYDAIYNTTEQELSQFGKNNLQLPFDEWKRVADNVVWNVKQLWEFLDK